MDAHGAGIAIAPQELNLCPLDGRTLQIKGARNAFVYPREIIIRQAAVPVVVDAGLGAPSHAAARDPVRMAAAFKAAVECAREAFEAGLPSQFDHAEASSPLAAFLKESSEPGDHRAAIAKSIRILCSLSLNQFDFIALVSVNESNSPAETLVRSVA